MVKRNLAFLGMSASVLAGGVGAQPAIVASDHPVLELRQYKLVAGYQDRFIDLFDSKFVESQEALGIQMVGQFHDHDRRDRFTWLRSFPNMAERGRALQSFYFGPVWAQYKSTANPMLDDNDNVLLLRPAREGSGFGPTGSRPALGARGGRSDTYFVVIEYLWKDPNEGFASFFLDQVSPLISKAGLPILGVYVPEEQSNNFPRLPVRPDKRMLVWFTKASTPDGFAGARDKLRSSRAWKDKVAAGLADAEEREPQVLRLDPTPRSALR
jgi:hypothetical protein